MDQAMPTTSIAHFTHPGHQLVKTAGSDSRGFTCAMCKRDGSGPRYRCEACNFDLHEHCTARPATLQSFAHPPHQLQLVPPPADQSRARACYLCPFPVLGYSYRCAACDFDLHPLCSLLQPAAYSVLHPQHPLTLNRSVPSACAACGMRCVLWQYSCGQCMFHVHTSCLHGAPPQGRAHGASGSTSGSGGGRKRDEVKRILLEIFEHAAPEAVVDIINCVINDNNN